MDKQRLNNKIFITILFMISAVFMFCFFRNSTYVNQVDNRSAYRFTTPSIKSLLNGEYQDNMDETIADQMPKYNYFKLLYLKITNYTNTKSVRLFNLDKKNKYVKLGNVNLYNDYLVYSIEDIATNNKIIDVVNSLSDNTNSNVYFYYINTDSNYNFETGYKSDEFDYIKNKLKTNNISSLDIPSFDEYKNYFYKTDHHWNYKGSYKGYTDIANLMNLDILDIKDEVCFDIPFSGSKTRDLAGINLITETSCMYTFDMPDFDIYISGEKVDNYGNPIDELKSSHEITYGNMYGFDYDEILFVNKNSNNNKKLLIFSNSFSNAINKLLASNYKETYVLDERHYENLNLIDYINSKKIDDVLILGNHMLFIDSVNW